MLHWNNFSEREATRNKTDGFLVWVFLDVAIVDIVIPLEHSLRTRGIE
jgi:hypothetical protein